MDEAAIGIMRGVHHEPGAWSVCERGAHMPIVKDA
jgi:hypothetical protein